MSYILEALKKSEQERGEQTIPDIQTTHAPTYRPQTTNQWPIIAAAIIAANAVILTIFWLKPLETFSANNSVSMVQSNPQPPTINSQEALNTNNKNQQVNSTPIAVNRFEPIQSQPTNPPTNRSASNTISFQPADQDTDNQPITLATETNEDGWEVITPKTKAQKAQQQLEMEAEISSPIDDFITISPKTQVAMSTPDMTLDQTNSDPTLVPGYLKFSELPFRVRNNFPKLEFSGHIYSTDKSFRRVIINGSKLREGAVISNGITLDGITPDGIIISADGYTFEMDVVGRW